MHSGVRISFYLWRMKKSFVLGILLGGIYTGFSQHKAPQEELYLIGNDSIPQSGISLKEVVVFQPLRFKTNADLKRYILLRRRVFRVYPYAKLAADRLAVLNERLANIESKRKRKKYLKRLEKFVYEEFEEELKKLSKSQGRILIRLVHRQTGSTTYDLVKELRTGWKAFVYQTTASLFKLSLKDQYNPEEVLEDYLIEDILQRAFANQYLVEQPAAIDYDLDVLYALWKEKR